jgi:tetratricopeptide (TPR) repeat protein
VGTAAITAAFLANFIVQQVRGTPASPFKIPVMAASFGFWWYARVSINDVILGTAMFEIFHDVQYLAITWMFNRKRITANHSMGRVSKFLFQPLAQRVILYAGLCFIYGAAVHMVGVLGLEVRPSSDAMGRLLVSLVAFSALLHFYYDGFIWKLRDKSTRSSLGLKGGTADRVRPLLVAVGHAMKWSVIVIPSFALVAALQSGTASVIEQRRAIAEVFPSATTHLSLGKALLREKRIDDAAEAYRAAASLDPSHPMLARGLLKVGEAYFATGETENAVNLVNEAISVAPTEKSARSIQAQLDKILSSLESGEP